MAQKMNAKAMRMQLTKDWSSMWFAEGRAYRDQLQEDIALRSMVSDRLRMAGLDKIEIVRSLNNLTVNVYVARPGVAIGRGGEGIDLLKKDLEKKFKKNIDVKINEIKRPQLAARVVARSIADAIEHRQSPKRAMSSEREKVMQAGADGVRIEVSGRINGAEIARTLKDKEGPVPLQTLRADIDFAEEVAETSNAGLLGVKVWIYRKPQEDDKDNNNKK